MTAARKTWNDVHVAAPWNRVAKNRGYHEVCFRQNGEPMDVLEYRQFHNVDERNHDTERDQFQRWLLQQYGSLFGMSSGMHRTSGRWVRLAVQYGSWNPADMNTVQGTYGSPYPPSAESVSTAVQQLNKSAFDTTKTIAGSAGLAKVLQVVQVNDEGTVSDVQVDLRSSEPSGFCRPDDWVTFGAWPGIGVLRSTMWVPEESIVRLNHDAFTAMLNQNQVNNLISPAALYAPLFQVGGTAYRMLHDHLPSMEGQVILQNAGNSAVGIVVSQMVAAAGGHSISLIRKGERTDDEFQALQEYLLETGRNHAVYAEDHLIHNKAAVKDLQVELHQLASSGNHDGPELALNAVGGSSAMVLQHLLGTGGIMVTYGGMSRKPVTIGTAQFIFKDLRLFGYWQSRWMVNQYLQQVPTVGIEKPSSLAVRNMNDALMDMVMRDQVQCPPVKVFSLHQLKEALQDHEEQAHQVVRSKIVFDCREQV